MQITFGCGETLNLEDLNQYKFLYYPDEGGDSYIGEEDQEFWDVDITNSDSSEICFRQTDGHSQYLEDNGAVYVCPEELTVYDKIVVNQPLPLDKQMELAKTVLSKVRLASPKAVVSGGAARCFLQGEQANDIDIFLDLPPYLDRYEMEAMLINLLPEYRVTQLRGGSATQPSEVTGLRAAYQMFKDGQEVQLLVVEGRPDEQMNRFPYSHTQVSWDGNHFTKVDAFDMFLDFKVVVKNYEPQQTSYKNKVESLIQKRGWAMAQSQDEALTMAMDSIKLTA